MPQPLLAPPSLAQQILALALEHAAQASTPTGIEDLLRDILAQRSAVQLLRDLHQQAEASAWSASRSSQHPLGFAKLILTKHAGYTLRCHVWQAKTTPNQEHVHNHAAAFASAILFGQYLDKRFEEVPLSAGESGSLQVVTHVKYPSKEGLEDRAPVVIAQTSLRQTQTITRKQGDLFAVPLQALRATEVTDSLPTISFVLQGPGQIEWTDVFMPLSGRMSSAPSSTFSAEAFIAVLQEVIATLE